MHSTHINGVNKSLETQPPIVSRDPVVQHAELARLVLGAWEVYIDGTKEGDLDSLAIPAPLKEEFAKIKGELSVEGSVPSGKIIRQHGITTLESLIGKTRTLTEQIADLTPDLSQCSLTRHQWQECLGRIIDRLEKETNYFNDAISVGALRISQKGLYSAHFKAAILPITFEPFQQLIKQPIFFPDSGVILFPGNLPSPQEIVTSMAIKGEMPASFLRLQECVADILTWPLAKRLGSFALNMVAGLATLPFNLVIRAALFVPRIFGVQQLKRNPLALSVDPTLDAAFTIINTDTNNKPHLDENHSQNHYIAELEKWRPRDREQKRTTAVRSIMLLRALGFSMEKIGELINGAHYDPKKDRFTKLERIIGKECKKLHVRTEQGRDHLLELDDSVWRLATSYSRLQGITIAREELIKAQKSVQNPLNISG